MFDIHTHIWPPERTSAEMRAALESRGLDILSVLSPDGLLKAIEGVCDAAVVHTMSFGENADNTALEVYHEFVRAAVSSSGGKLYAFCNIDPRTPVESLMYLRRYIESGDFIGLKVHQNIQEVYANDERMFPIYAQMQEYGLPVMYHTGGIGITPFFDKYSDMNAIDEVACRYPELPVILGHAGRGHYVEAASMLRKHKNVYADISANFAKDAGFEHTIMAELINTVKQFVGGADKLMFGSDYPF